MTSRSSKARLQLIAVGAVLALGAAACGGSSGGGGSGDKGRLISNEKHHPSSKSPQPKNVEELFEKSIPDTNGVRWAKDSDGIIHRFSPLSNGERHWNGSTAGSKPIRLDKVPIEIRRILK